MGISVERQELIQVLQAIEPGLAGAKEILEQSACFCFKDGKIWSFNDELACHITSPVGDFEGAIVAKPFLEVLNKLKADTLDVSYDATHLILKGKGFRTVKMRFEAEIQLPLDAVDEPEEWKDLHEDFCDAVGTVQHCASHDKDQGYENTCVHVAKKWVEACDSVQLCRWKLKTGFQSPILIRQSSIKHITSSGVNEFGQTDQWTHFRAPSGLVISCRYTQEEFTDYTPEFDFEGTSVTLPKGLADDLPVAEIFSRENIDNNKVKVELRKGEMWVRGIGINGESHQKKKLNWDGDPHDFWIAPQLLSNLITKHESCEIGKEKIKVNAGKFVYVTTLEVDEDRHQSNGEESGE